MPQGSYLVLPFLGPSTARGIPGAVFDTAANPATYVGMPVQLVSMLNARASAEGALKFIDEAALDPYVFTRESFLQWRNNLATDGKAEASRMLMVLKTNRLTAIKALLPDKVRLLMPMQATRQVLLCAWMQRLKRSEQVSHSFSSVAQSFDNTAKSFEDAGTKVDELKKSKR